MTHGRRGNGMRLIRACVVAGAASLLIGVPAASAAPKLTIKSKNRVILYGGKSTKITGHLSGVNPNSGQQIRLQENPYPFAGFNDVATTTTDAAGNYQFIRPVTTNPSFGAGHAATARLSSSRSGRSIASGLTTRSMASTRALRASASPPASRGGASTST